MSNDISDHPGLLAVIDNDPRYPLEAYRFVMRALAFTVRERPRPGHISGRELLDGVRRLGINEYGRLARLVFKTWNVSRTDDVGAIVFNLVEAGLLSRRDNDRIEDFIDAFDLATSLDAPEDYTLSQ